MPWAAAGAEMSGAAFSWAMASARSPLAQSDHRFEGLLRYQAGSELVAGQMQFQIARHQFVAALEFQQVLIRTVELSDAPAI